jgi:hypothetical protein
MKIHCVLRHEGGTLTRGRGDCLARELPKNGGHTEVPALSENGSLMPSAGTFSIQKITWFVSTAARVRRQHFREGPP